MRTNSRYMVPDSKGDEESTTMFPVLLAVVWHQWEIDCVGYCCVAFALNILVLLLLRIQLGNLKMHKSFAISAFTLEQSVLGCHSICKVTCDCDTMVGIGRGRYRITETGVF